MTTLRRLAENFLIFCSTFDIPLYPWQIDTFGEACRRDGGRFVHPLAGISVPRGNGKSYGAACVGAWRLVCGPQPQEVLSLALGYEGARVILDHAKRIFRSHRDLEATVELRADSILVPATGARWQIKSREHSASRGLHPDLVLFDEVGWLKDDELFASSLASQASVADPLTLLTSTVGRRQAGPLWTIKQLAEREAAEAGA
jgi:phage terminase large subunit-like protein